MASQYTYSPKSQKVKKIRQSNLVSQQDVTSETYFLKNHTQNVVEELFPDPFLKKSRLSISLDRQSKV